MVKYKLQSTVNGDEEIQSNPRGISRFGGGVGCYFAPLMVLHNTMEIENKWNFLNSAIEILIKIE